MCRPGSACALAFVASFAAATLWGTGTCLAQAEGDAFQRSVELVGGAVSSLADRLDSFLGNDRTEAEANRTRLRLGGGVGQLREDGTKLEANVDLRLSLPRTGGRLSLFANGAADEQPDATAKTDSKALSLVDERRFEASGIGLRYFLVRERDQSLRLDAGGQKGINMDPFVRPRHRLSFDAAPWTLNFIEEATWSLDDGFSAEALMDADWQIDHRTLFRLTPVIHWEEENPGFGYGVSARELLALGPSRVIEGVVGFNFLTEPNNRLQAAILRVRYRQTLGWDWLEVEVAPELGFQRIHNYAANPGIFVRFQVTFGPAAAKADTAGPQRSAVGFD